MRPYVRALSDIRSANTQEALIRALASFPGSPSDLGGNLEQPLAQVRAQLIHQIEPQLNVRQNQLDLAQGRLWQEGVLRWLKDALVSFFSAVAFAAIGLSSVDRRRA